MPMGNWTYDYDALGNLTGQTDARGCVLTLGYDLLNRLTNKTSSGAGCDPFGQITTSYTYDIGTNGKGRRTSMNDASGSTSWLYDTRGRATKETKNITGTSAFVTEWDYNSADLLEWMKYPDTEELTYAYNNLGLLASITNNSGQVYIADTQYDKAGRILSMDYGASVIRKTFNYYSWTTADQGGLLNTATTVKLSNQSTLQSFAYTYDKNANISTILDNQAGPQIQTFGYDQLNRLTSASAAGGANGLYSESYTYDAMTGNLASKAGVNYTYDPNHAHAVAALSNGNTYIYDANGNMIQRNVNALTFDLAYDAENRLVSVASNGTAPTATATQTPAPTNTPTATATHTSTPGGPTATFTPTPTITNTPTATNTPGGPTATPTQSGNTITLQPNGADGIDTYLLNTSPTTNNGTAVVMWVGESNNATNKIARSLIKFDLSSIPSNASITSATLSLWTDADFSDNDRTIRVYRLKVPFNETEATWEESANGVGWHGVGASGTNDREGTDIGAVLIPADQALDVEKQISLSTAQIQEMVNGTFTNNGFAIAADTETDDRFNYKTSDATASTKRPKLVIQYTVPQGHMPSHILANTLPRFGAGQGAVLSGEAVSKRGGHFVNYIMPKALLQSGSLSFTPADDAHIFNASPSNNYGTATTLQVDDSPIKHFLLKFDVTGINSQTVTNAKLCLYNVDGASAGGDFYHVSDDSWQEETVTWNNAPAADTTLLGSLGQVSANTWYEVNLTSLITGDGTYSLRISDSVGGADY